MTDRSMRDELFRAYVALAGMLCVVAGGLGLIAAFGHVSGVHRATDAVAAVTAGWVSYTFVRDARRLWAGSDDAA